MEYFVVFISSIFLAWLAEVGFRKEKKLLPYILIAVSILLPCILAGFRDDTIGTDVTWYVTPLVDRAYKAIDFFDYFEMQQRDSMEIGFVCLIYFLTFSFDAGPTLFLLQLCILVPLYIALFRYRDRMPVWLGLTIFYFMSYNTGLSIIRQTLTITLLLCAFSFIEKKQWLVGTIIIFLSITIHRSAIFLAFFVIATYYLCRIRKVKPMAVILAVSILVFMGNFLMDLMRGGAYDEYASRALERTGEAGLSMKSLALYSCLTIIPFCKKGEQSIAAIVALCGFVIYFMTIYSSYYIRLAMGPILFSTIAYPSYINTIKPKQRKKYILIVLATLFIYWFVGVILHGGDETYPYMMRIPFFIYEYVR